ncbi:MAG: chromosome segregation protein SMC [Rhodocyclaceae bacterium]|nr:chromosome segregation protein SMC [Rhodocyclaceae bacterium]
MRLTKLKLAGFKTFVDPTTILLPGQLVGVVGPNGCGKSNVIDAVRWVLGESRASALRGESMQDVIFNGSNTRKPVGRASVELEFDNSLGRAAGQWSQYAEIAIRRVMERDGQSDYYINGLRVRRRDVIDVFLGTGLGPRAYAIIEQGMISRIIEAKPEELRLFLEEAAGVTKYRERRKETENRLDDARENLARIEDIRGELGQQIQKLTGQAEIAQRYRDFKDALALAQSLLWLLKRNAGSNEAERCAREAAATQVALDEQGAQITELETRLVAMREEHYRASDTVHAAQGELYAANAEVARIEGELRRAAESRQRLDARLLQLAAEQRNWSERQETYERDYLRWQELAEHAAQRAEVAEARHAECTQNLPAAESLHGEAEAVVARLRRELAQAEQQLRVEETHRASTLRALEALAARRRRLDEDGAAEHAPDPEAVEVSRERVYLAGEQQHAAHARMQDAAVRAQELQSALRAAQEEERTANRALTSLRARTDALAQLQARTQAGGKLGDWLAGLGLAAAEPLWRTLEVETGWEAALEAVLRERVAALRADAATAARALATPPPVSLALVFEAAGGAAGESSAGGLAARVRCSDAHWNACLAQWLDGIECVENVDSLLAGALPGAASAWVDKAGRMVTREALSFYAPDARTQGVLERQREIDELAARMDAAEHAASAAHAVERDLEAQLQAQNTEQADARRAMQEATAQLHAAELEAMKLGQMLARHEERLARRAADRAEIDAADGAERQRAGQVDIDIARAAELADGLRERLDEAAAAQRDAELRLRDARAQEQAAAREAQEAKFSERECATRLADLTANRTLAAREIARIAAEISAGAAERAGIDLTALDEFLQDALRLKLSREQTLADLRRGMEDIAARLSEAEQARLKTEHGLAPMRDKLADLRLKQQAAELAVQQYGERLAEAGADLHALLPKLTRDLRESALNAEIGRLTRDIDALGPVNLAALEELDTAGKRKRFLDEQYADLSEAITTLENAIRRIDRETRQQLQETYDRVNAEFGRLFPELFGGGEARLVMTGEEILDAGVQVMAHPPGKKNASIHLLSGGEKALTAIALVFAMFRLNPAPFCMLDEVDAPLDDSNTVRFCEMVKRMSGETQFVFISHNKITMEMAAQLVGVTMQERGVSRVVEVDVEQALRIRDEMAA